MNSPRKKVTILTLCLQYMGIDDKGMVVKQHFTQESVNEIVLVGRFLELVNVGWMFFFQDTKKK